MEPVLRGSREERPDLGRPRVLIPAGAAVVLAVAGITAFLELSGPSYPHSWCGPVFAELHAKGGSEQSYEDTMARLQQQDHAPVGQLLSDLYAYDAARANEESADDLQLEGALGAEMAALTTVGDDLKVLNQECGQPKGAYEKDEY